MAERAKEGTNCGLKILYAVLVSIALYLGIEFYLFGAMREDLAFIPGDLIDGRLNNYFLEHGFKWLVGEAPSFWNPSFFYPTGLVMAFSDNHLGTLPIYAVFRLMSCDRETAYQLWFFAVFTLNFVSAAWTLRRFSFNLYGVIAGSFLFTFSLPAIGQLAGSHSQLLPRFWTPLAIYFTIAYLRAPQSKNLCLALLFTVGQYYCTIYMGYFLSLSQAALLISYIVLNPGEFRSHVRQIPPSGYLCQGGILVLCALSLLPLLLPYYTVSKTYGTNSWEEISGMLPTFWSYFYPARPTLLWGHLETWVGPWLSHFPQPGEHKIFVGVLPWMFFVGTPFLFLRNRDDPNLRLGVAVCGALAILWVLTFQVQGFSLYRVIALVPGAGAVRAVTRIVLAELFLFALLAGVIFKFIQNRSELSTGRRHALMAVLLFLVIVEHSVERRKLMGYSKALAQDRIQNLVKEARAKHPRAKILAYLPSELYGLREGVVPKDYAQPHLAAMAINLDAMLAAQTLNTATLNGHSRLVPHGYVYNWLRSHYDDPAALEYAMMRTSLREDIPPGSLFEGLVLLGQEGLSASDLLKSLENRRCSKSSEALPDAIADAVIRLSPASVIVAQKQPSFDVKLHLENQSSAMWPCLGDSSGRYRIFLSYGWLNDQGQPLSGYGERIPLYRDMPPGAQQPYRLTIPAPRERGHYYLEFDLVQEHVFWFRDRGSRPGIIDVRVQE